MREETENWFLPSLFHLYPRRDSNPRKTGLEGQVQSISTEVYERTLTRLIVLSQSYHTLSADANHFYLLTSKWGNPRAVIG